jgi:hypothetical protein
MSRKSIKFLFIFLILILGILISTLTTVDWSPLEEQEYYHETLKSLEKLKWNNGHNEFWLSGWGEANYTPPKPATLVGYKPRGNYEFIQDSSYVKCLILSDGEKTIAFLNYELLIVHPHLYHTIHAAVKKEQLPVDQLYFTATHTHSGLGGYIPGIMGKVAFGGYDSEIVQIIEEKTLASLKQALNSLDTATVFFDETSTKGLVSNRFIPTDPVDPIIRKLIVEKTSGEKAIMLTFAAHPTILSPKFMGLSGDYPYYLTKKLTSHQYDFAIFAAGIVGSQKAEAEGNEIQHVIHYANTISEEIKNDSIHEKSLPILLDYQKINIHLRSPHYRISENIRLRPWVFNVLFGDTNTHLNMVKIGDVLMIGTSAELSGVFMEDWSTIAKKHELKLMITSFNGGYMGYVTPDAYYNYKYHEVRDMNFFGPYNGKYYQDLILKAIEKAK